MVYDSPKSSARDPQDIDFKENNSASHGFAQPNPTSHLYPWQGSNEHRVSPIPQNRYTGKFNQRQEQKQGAKPNRNQKNPGISTVPKQCRRVSFPPLDPWKMCPSHPRVKNPPQKNQRAKEIVEISHSVGELGQRLCSNPSLPIKKKEINSCP